MANTYTLISSNVLSSSAASVTFSSIPATYTDLVLRYSVRDDSANTYGGATLKFNGSSTGYSHTDLRTITGTTASSSQLSNQTEEQLVYSVSGGGTTANTFANSELYIPNYAGSANKCFSGDYRPENNATSAGRGPGIMAILWSNTSAITSFVLTPTFATNFVSGSSFYLYGIKNS